MMKYLIIIVFSLMLLIQSGVAQEEPQPSQQQEQPRVIDLTKLGKTYKISARMELPQVRMFDRRIKPDFKEVTADKSFENELSTQVEQFNYEPITSGKVQPIKNIDALLNKKRF